MKKKGLGKGSLMLGLVTLIGTPVWMLIAAHHQKNNTDKARQDKHINFENTTNTKDDTK